MAQTEKQKAARAANAAKMHAANAARKASAESAPKRPTAKLPVSKKMTDSLIVLVNTGWQVSPWRENALTEVEAEALSRSLLRAAQSNVYLGNIINKITTATAEAQLIGCIGAIVVVRLAKRGTVPPILGMTAEMMLNGIAGEEMPTDGASFQPIPDVPQDDMANTTGVGSEPTPNLGVGEISLSEAANLADIRFGESVRDSPLNGSVDPIRTRGASK